jgi:hypothetical protein
MNISFASSSKKGLVIGICMIIVSFFCFYVLHLPENGNSQYAVLLVYVIGMIWVMDAARQKFPEGKFGALFQEGFRAFIVCTLLMVLYTYVFYKMNPEIVEVGIRINNKLLEAQGDKTAAEIAANSDKIRGLFMPMMISLSTIKYLFMGSLISAVMAVFFAQKSRA